MIAIDNTELRKGWGCCDVAGFAPKISYELTDVSLKVTEGSTFPAGDGLKVAHVKVYDRFGKFKTKEITAAAGVVTIDLTTDFNPLEGFNVLVTIVTNKRLTADLSIYGIGGTPIKGDMNYVNY